jgi:hypothetical protein
MNNKPTIAEMSKRWTHAESEERSIPRHADRMIHADISSWSHATSKPFGSVFKPIRPCENEILPRGLRSIPVNPSQTPLPKGTKPLVPLHDTNLVVIPFEERKPEVVKADSEAINRITKEVNKRFDKLVIVRAPAAPEPQPIPDDAWTPISKEAFEALKAKNIQVPRE